MHSWKSAHLRFVASLVHLEDESSKASQRAPAHAIRSLHDLETCALSVLRTGRRGGRRSRPAAGRALSPRRLRGTRTGQTTDVVTVARVVESYVGPVRSVRSAAILEVSSATSVSCHGHRREGARRSSRHRVQRVGSVDVLAVERGHRPLEHHVRSHDRSLVAGTPDRSPQLGTRDARWLPAPQPSPRRLDDRA